MVTDAVRMRPLRAAWSLPVLVVALASAVAVESFITAVTVLMHGPAHWYGAPIPVGQSYWTAIFQAEAETTFSVILFALDVLIMWVILATLGRWAGWPSALSAVVAAPVGVIVTLLLMGDRLPGGIPGPVLDPHLVPPAIVLWIVDLLLAFGLVWAIRALGRTLRPLRSG